MLWYRFRSPWSRAGVRRHGDAILKIWGRALRLASFVTLLSCVHQKIKPLAPIVPTIELALDNGRAAEKPLTPSKTFEILIKYDPSLALYRPERLRFLLAQPGHLVFSFYQSSTDGTPGTAIGSIERIYDAAFLSNGKDGKWVVELLRLPAQKGPLWIGLSSVPGSDDPRLWSSSLDSNAVFQRDADPTTPLQATKIRRTPLLRLEITPLPATP